MFFASSSERTQAVATVRQREIATIGRMDTLTFQFPSSAPYAAEAQTISLTVTRDVPIPPASLIAEWQRAFGASLIRSDL